MEKCCIVLFIMGEGTPLLFGKRSGPREARRLHGPIKRLRAMRVLDPARGSGNVLYNVSKQRNEFHTMRGVPIQAD